MDLCDRAGMGLWSLVVCVVVSATAANGRQAPAIDIEAAQLACHGETPPPTITHAVACAQAEQAHVVGDDLALYGMVEIMRRQDPDRALPCTRRFEPQMESIHGPVRIDYRAGLTAMKAGELERARACLQLAVAKEPDNQLAARRLGEVQAALDEQAAEAQQSRAQPPAMSRRRTECAPSTRRTSRPVGLRSRRAGGRR